MFTNRNTPPITTAQVFKPEKASEPTSKIELSLSCKYSYNVIMIITNI